MSFKVTAAATAAAVLLIAPAAASAATEIFTAALPTDGSAFTLDKFNTALGTLTGVTLDFSATVTIEPTALNFGPAGSTYTSAKTSTTETVTGPGGPLVTNFTVTDGPGLLPLTGITTNFLPSFTSTDSASASILSTAFAAFETAGSGTIGYTAVLGPFASIGTAGSNQAEFFGGDGALQGGSLKVTYDYTAAVPEPAAWALMILGFGGAGAMLRRRRTALA